MNQLNNCSFNDWQHPTKLPTLDKDRVHLWRASLDLSDLEIARLASVLSSDETERANRFRFARHRRRFIVARGILRQLLGNYLDIEPKDLQFYYGDRGKPYLKDKDKLISLQFNLSHSKEYALYGFTYHYPIGVDLEYLREMPDLIKIARRFFSSREYELLIEANEPVRLKLFFQLCTAKEAYLKAIGTGIAELADVELDMDEALSLRLLAIGGDKLAAVKWSLCSCNPATNYIASVAIKTTPPVPIDFWHWHQN